VETINTIIDATLVAIVGHPLTFTFAIGAAWYYACTKLYDKLGIPRYRNAIDRDAGKRGTPTRQTPKACGPYCEGSYACEHRSMCRECENAREDSSTKRG
jgi:hypothetical protein